MRKRNAIVDLLSQMDGFYLKLFGITLFSLLAGVLKTWISLQWGTIVDLGSKALYNSTIFQAVALIFIILVDGIRTVVHYRLVGHVSENFAYTLRKKIFNVVLKANVKELESKTGEIITRVNSDIEDMTNAVGELYPLHSRLILQALIAMVACLYICWPLALIYFLVVPFTIWAVAKVSKPILAQLQNALSEVSQSNNIVAEILQGLHTIKAFNLQGLMLGRFRRDLDSAYIHTQEIEKMNARLSAIKYVSSVIQTVVLYALGGYMAIKGIISVGNIISFILVSAYVTEAFYSTDWIVYEYKRAMALSGRLLDLLALKAERHGGLAKERAADTLVEFNNVSFSYGNKEVLRNVSFKLEKNQVIALFGASGCGKSTIMKLICGLYQDYTGDINILGQSLKAVSLTKIRDRISVVLQEPFLFNSSIEDNVTCGSDHITGSEVASVLEQLHMISDNDPSSKKLSDPVGEHGCLLSGGQRQRISIARALLKDADILLLDEPSSALDNENEVEVQRMLDEIRGTRSMIIISHRPRLLQNVDYIYCLDDGHIVEEGTPEMLLEQKGFYYSAERQGVMT